MRNQFTGIAVAALFAIAPTLPGHAEETGPAAASPPTQAAPAAPANEPPASVPRPSIAPKSVDAPRSPDAPKTAGSGYTPSVDEAAPRRHRRYAQRHYRRYAYWEPFPVYLPHFYRHRVHWSRIPWFSF